MGAVVTPIVTEVGPVNHEPEDAGVGHDVAREAERGLGEDVAPLQILADQYQRLGAAAELAPFEQLSLEQTEGNPFCIEEVKQPLIEEQVLRGERGHYRFEQIPTTLHIPATVQGVIAARIDRLEAAEKALLQTL